MELQCSCGFLLHQELWLCKTYSQRSLVMPYEIPLLRQTFSIQISKLLHNHIPFSHGHKNINKMVLICILALS